MLAGLSSLTILQRLYLFECNFKDVLYLSNLALLENLQICHCKRLEILPNLLKLTRLKTLDVRSCERLGSGLYCVDHGVD